MSVHKCHIQPNKKYEIKQRYIPTYVHQPIFEEIPSKPSLSRCTPTFHSTVFDNEGYQIVTVHQKRQKPQQVKAQHEQQKQQEAAKNVKQEKQFTLGQSHVFNLSRDKWYDHTKQQLLGSIQNGQNRLYSRERKYVDMSSDPVFTDYNYEKKNGNINQIQTVKILEKPLLVDQNVQTNEQQKIENPSEKIQEKSENSEQKVSDIQDQLKQTKKNVKFTKTEEPKLTMKGKKTNNRPHTAKKPKCMQQKPTFTVIRKSRVHQ